MTPQQWKQIKHFNPNEKWGDPERMDFRLVWILDQIRRHFLGRKIIIHCGYEISGHSEYSFHHRDGLGRAVDFHIDGIKDVPMLIVIGGAFHALLPFCRLGIYPHWNSPGYHIDVGSYTNIKYKRWIKLKNAKYEYFGDVLHMTDYCSEVKRLILVGCLGSA